MFSLSSITATFASTQKKFKKFGKKLRKQRDGEVDGIKHKDFFKKNKTPTTPGSETTAIDFYEKP
jgi:hypothetical protein